MKTKEILVIVGLVLGPVGNASAALVAHYQLEGNPLDSSANEWDGTELGGPSYAAGVLGQAISLDGFNDWVDLDNPPHWPAGTSARTMCAWAMTDTVAPGWRWIVAYGTPAVSDAMFIGMNGDDLFGGGYSDDVRFNDFWEVGAWHHICLTYDGTTARLYADGVEVASGAKNWDVVLSRARIGRQVNDAAEFWDGLVDDVRIYDRVLSCGEIARLAARGVGCSTIDFEDFAADTVITDQYCGVTFSAPDTRPGGTCDGDAVITDAFIYGGTYSGTQALRSRPGGDPFYCELSPEHLRMVFDAPQEEVSFRVGPRGTIVVEAYDQAWGGMLVSSQSVYVGDITSPLQGAYTLVSVSSPTKNIRRIDIDGGVLVTEIIDDLLFGVDGTPPVARIDNPAFHACACGTVNVMGEACDDDGAFGMYKLEYRHVDDPKWTLINSSIYFACNGGHKLGEWDTSSLPKGGWYYVRLTVTNACGLMSSATTVVFVDRAFDTIDLRYPGTGQVVRGSQVCLDGTVWDAWCGEKFTVEYRELPAGAWKPVGAGTYPCCVANDPLTPPGDRWNTAVIPDGDYELRVEGIDQCGNTLTVTRAVVVDNTAPTAVITSPANCVSVQGQVPIQGTANDANLRDWVLEYTGGDANNWVTITGPKTAPIVNGLLGTWNTTGLRPCAYTIRLRVWDNAVLDCQGLVNYSEYTVSVDVE